MLSRLSSFLGGSYLSRDLLRFGSAGCFWHPASSLRCSLSSLPSSWWRFDPVLDSSPCFLLGGKSFFGSLPLPPHCGCWSRQFRWDRLLLSSCRDGCRLLALTWLKQPPAALAPCSGAFSSNTPSL